MRKAVRVVVWIGAGLVAIWGALVVLGLMYFAFMIFSGIRPIPLPGVCTTEATGRALNVAGFDFEFEEINCDVIAKDSAMTVYVSRHGARQRFALVRYAGNPPTVTPTGPNHVRVSLGEIWGLHFRHDEWDGLHVDYDFSMFKPPPQ